MSHLPAYLHHVPASRLLSRSRFAGNRKVLKPSYIVGHLYSSGCDFHIAPESTRISKIADNSAPANRMSSLVDKDIERNDADGRPEEGMTWETNEDRRNARERSLWYWNLVCGLFHLLQAIFVLGLGLNPKGNAIKFKLPLTTLFLNWSSGYPVQNLVVQGYLPFVAVTSGFSWMSAAAHFIVLILFQKYYIPDLRRGINRFRWIEYAFSSSLMIGLIAMLFGMYDIISLVLIMSVNACMNLFGFLMETTNMGKENYDWAPFHFGALAGAAPWACIFAYIGGSGSESIPSFVFGILTAYLVMFNIFPINMILQYRRIGYWSDKYWGYQKGGYYFGEIIYQILSLVAKTLLLWLVFGGSNQPNVGY